MLRSPSEVVPRLMVGDQIMTKLGWFDVVAESGWPEQIVDLVEASPNMTGKEDEPTIVMGVPAWLILSEPGLCDSPLNS